MGLKERLLPALRAGDIDAGWQIVRDLSAGERREAKAWFESSKRWIDGLYEREFSSADPMTGQYDPTRSEGTWERFTAAQTILCLVAIELCGPVTCARRVASTYWGHDGNHAHAIHALWEKPSDWVARLVTELAEVVGEQPPVVAEIVRAAAVHHMLPCPSGPGFLEMCMTAAPTSWEHVEGTYYRSVPKVEEWFDRDPLLPDLMYYLLASDHCGSHQWIPPSLPLGVRRGLFDRSRLLAILLDSLITQHRPSAQKAMAESLSTLDLTADEIDGGLDYLMGVLATTKSAVMKVLLPHALVLVASADDLQEVTLLVAGREKVHKTTLLRALTKGDLATRIGQDGVRDALSILAADDDLRYAADVATALEKMGGVAEVLEPTTAAIGLWDLRPTPPASPPDEPDWWWSRQGGRPTLDRTMARGSWGDRFDHPEQLKHSTQDVLRAIASGEDWRTPITAQLDRLVSSGQLSLAKATRAFEDLFLGGGMREAYPEALRIADACTGVARKPAGLHTFLRMLGQYAAEVPADAGISVPVGVLALATDSGSTSAQAEARRLGAALTGATDIEVWLTGARAVRDPGSSAPAPSRGLWRQHEDKPLPAQVTLADNRQELAADLSALRAAVADPAGQSLPTHLTCHWPASMRSYFSYGQFVPAAEDELHLLAVVSAVSAHGADVVAAALQPLPAGHVFTRFGWDRQAIQAWVRGARSTDDYWRLALRTRNAHAVQAYARARGETGRRVNGSDAQWVLEDASDLIANHDPLLEEVPWLQTALAPDSPLATPTGNTRIDALPLLLARWTPQHYDRVVQLRMLELLVNTQHNDVVLAAPTRADFTLSFEDLVDRLRACRGRSVGALDLVQALHRLRPVDAARAAELDALTGDLGVRTTPALTSPGGEASWDAVDAVRRWVRAGGLPALDSKVCDGRWVSTASAPVPFSDCRALEHCDLGDAAWTFAYQGARSAPAWVERTVRTAYDTGNPNPLFPAGAASFGAPMHDQMLHLMSKATQGGSYDYLSPVRAALEHDRVNPVTFVDLAVQRHRVGALDLPHLLETTQLLGDEGRLREVWPLLLPLADALVAEPTRPPTLATLLRQLNGWVADVPEPHAPQRLVDFAASRGMTKAHVEARALVTRLRGTS